MATNNVPGVYTINFASTLKGITIKIGSADGSNKLPSLTGGNVVINGDIDGDGKPDVTLTTALNTSNTFGFFIESSGNALYALNIENLFAGVVLQPPSANSTLANTVISNLAINSSNPRSQGIVMISRLASSFQVENDQTNWINTTIVGNTVEVADVGIGIFDFNSLGDRLVHTRVINNTIRISGANPTSDAIDLGVGFWAGSRGNEAIDTLIAYNTISGTNAGYGMHIAAGEEGASGNEIVGLYITGNQMRFSTAKLPSGPFTTGMAILTGDGATDDLAPSLRPITYPSDNVIKNVSVTSNFIEGAGFGIVVGGGCCGAQRNKITDVHILGNTIKNTVPDAFLQESGVYINAGDDGGYFSRLSSSNEVSNVTIQSNTMQLSIIPPGAPLRQYVNNQTAYTWSNIKIWAGEHAIGNRVRDVKISNNYLNSSGISINVVGGVGDPASGYGSNSFPPISRTTNNTASRVQVSCNVIGSAPSIITPYYPEVKAINIAGGFLNATGNLVQAVSLNDNLVAGFPNVVSVFPNVGREALANAIGDIMTISHYPIQVGQKQLTVAVWTNSSVSAVTFDQAGKTLGFVMNDAFGGNRFLNATFPKTLLNESFSVTANGNPIPFTLAQNSTDYSIYASFPSGTIALQVAVQTTTATSTTTTSSVATSTTTSTSRTSPTQSSITTSTTQRTTTSSATNSSSEKTSVGVPVNLIIYAGAAGAVVVLTVLIAFVLKKRT